MITKYDVVKEQMEIIRDQQDLIRWQERDNAFLLCMLVVLMLWSVFEMVWR